MLAPAALATAIVPSCRQESGLELHSCTETAVQWCREQRWSEAIASLETGDKRWHEGPVVFLLHDQTDAYALCLQFGEIDSFNEGTVTGIRLDQHSKSQNVQKALRSMVKVWHNETDLFNPISESEREATASYSDSDDTGTRRQHR